MDPSIRLAVDADADALAEIYRPIVESTAISFETEPPGQDEMRRRILQTLSSHPWLVCDRDGEIAGYAYAARHRARDAYQWSVDTSIYVHPRYRRHGVARGLYTSLFAILTAQGYFNAFAGIALPNEPSVRLHEKLGFRTVGVYRRVGYKCGAWHDVGWWQLVLQQSDGLPEKPSELRVVRSRGEWPELLTRGLSMIHSVAPGT